MDETVNLGIKIHVRRESEPLGTAGPVSSSSSDGGSCRNGGSSQRSSGSLAAATAATRPPPHASMRTAVAIKDGRGCCSSMPREHACSDATPWLTPSLSSAVPWPLPCVHVVRPRLIPCTLPRACHGVPATAATFNAHRTVQFLRRASAKLSGVKRQQRAFSPVFYESILNSADLRPLAIHATTVDIIQKKKKGPTGR